MSSKFPMTSENPVAYPTAGKVFGGGAGGGAVESLGPRRALGDLTNTRSTALPPSLCPPSRIGAPAGLSSTPDIVDIDGPLASNPQNVTDYIVDIMESKFKAETASQCAPTYMTQQTDINQKMRAILIDWLVEVHLKFKLYPETLYLTINLIDRFLEKKLVLRSKLQLVGVTAMLLASKYEEIYAPEVRDFVYITDRAYTREQILDMESVMLSTLKFKLAVPTIYPFLTRFQRAAGANTEQVQLSTYYVERMLQEYDVLKFPPSMIAATAVFLAMKATTTMGLKAWTPTLQHHSHYALGDLRSCAEFMVRVLDGSSTANLKAVYRKYSNPKFGAVSKLPVPSLD